MVYSSERQIFDIQTRDIMYNPVPTKQRRPLQSVYVPRAMSAGQSCSPGRAPILMEQSKNTVRPAKCDPLVLQMWYSKNPQLRTGIFPS